MAGKTIVCEQAVFTSARGPTGEGYRIVAASKGIRADEKQKITRCSPSHESLCPPGAGEDSPAGVAFYSLGAGRLCVAWSRHAGAEQSGRGGQRVYTQNLILNEEDFKECESNPFHLIRALPDTDINLQKLQTAATAVTIPALELVVEKNSRGRFDGQIAALLPPPVRLDAVQKLLEGKPLVVELPTDWLPWAEAIVLAMPAPLRLKISFAAGLRYSAGRGHTLNILRDDKQGLETRVTAQGLGFLSAKTKSIPVQSNWLTLVDRYWAAGDLAGLSRRTTRPYDDCSAPVRERVGEWFNTIDDIPKKESLALLDVVYRTFQASCGRVEGEIRSELRDAVRQQLRSQLSVADLQQIRPVWARLVELFRSGGEQAGFAQPLIHYVLVTVLRQDPLVAAELAMSVSQIPPGVDREAHEAMLAQVGNRLTTIAPSHSLEDAQRLAGILARWNAIRPAKPVAAGVS